jgi:hypothetical protein
MNRRILLPVACLACLASTSFAQDIQARAEELLQHARQLSDIRSANAPAFQLKASFSFTGEDLENVQGTYTETWVSNSQWRRETVVGNLQKIEVGGPGKHWLLEPDGFPEPANRIISVMASPPAPGGVFAVESITEREMRGVTADCIESKVKLSGLPFAYCFEKKTGMLLEKVSPETRPVNLVSFSCEYGGFRKFGDYWFPRQIRCFADRHKNVSAEVVDLSRWDPVNQTLFDAPKNAIELGECSGKTVYPVAPTIMNTFEVPHLYTKRVKLWMVVDEKGRPQQVKVLPPSPKDSNGEVLDWVRHWNFSPGKCDGKPMAMSIIIETPSTHP